MWSRVLTPVWRTLKNACLDVCYGVDTASAMGHGIAPRPLPDRTPRTGRS